MTSPYKWYAPHSGMLWMRPQLVHDLPAYKVRPASDSEPSRFETGMPNFEALAGVQAAARFLIEETMASVQQYEDALFEPLLRGLQSIPGVTVYGEQGMTNRTPTAAFTIRNVSPADAAAAMAAERIALWDGHNYAIEVVNQLGLDDSGGVIRAGISRYLEPEHVQRLLDVTARLAS